MSDRAASISYRADIDGLRAVCVVAVILFHASVPGFAGGYVGVDVFFVVSGYLITLLLIEPTGATLGSRMKDFYVRRARRILPALLVVLASSAAVAVVLFLPSDLWRFGRSLAYAAALVGNFGAWIGGGYFDLGGPFTPLQHLWSIGVEEQFYLAYPFVLLLAGRYFGRYRAALIVALTFSSLALCLWASYRHPVANFYVLPTRAWQLLCGALVALGVVRAFSRRSANEALAALSLGVLVATVLVLEPTTPYPGLRAILPTVAATLLIATATRQPTLVSRLLSLRPLVVTGLISYSLYLWHAPILAFFRYYNIKEPSVAALAVLLTAIYLISFASWRFIERPVRTRRVPRSDRSFAVVSVAAVLAASGVGLLFWSSGGLPGRFATADIGTATRASEELPVVAPACVGLTTERIAAGDLCSYGSAGPDVTKVLVWGDSHAHSLLPVYESLTARHRIQVYFGIMGGCRPLSIDVAHEQRRARALCARFNAAMIEMVRRLDPDLVILNAYWLDRDTNLPGTNPALVVDEPEFRRSLERLLQQIDSSSRSVCAVLTVPTHKYPVPYALAMTQRRALSDDFVAVTRADALAQYENVERDLRLLEQGGVLRVVDPKDVLCPTDQCLVRDADGAPLYRDRHHLSLVGAELVAGVVERCFEAGAR